MSKIFNVFSYTIIIVLFFIVFSCSRQKEEKESIARAEKIIEQQPDSALQLLNTILFPKELSKSQFNKYTLLLIQAEDKCYKDITSDTAIFAVKEYYEQERDYPNAALAAFYCGRALHKQNKMNEATEAYGEAERLADKTNNFNLKGLILGNWGILHWEHASYEKAIELNKRAADMYEKAQNYKNEIYALRLIGDCFLLNNKTDSAFYYYNASLKLAASRNLPGLQSDVKQNIGVAFRQQGLYEEAKIFFNEALAIAKDSVGEVRILLNLAQVYILENKVDSANFYLDRALALHIDDPWLMRSSYLLRSSMEEQSNRYKEALGDYKEYYRYIVNVYDSEKSNKLLEIQGKYDFEKLRVSKRESELSFQKVLTILSLALFVSGVIIFIYYRKYTQNESLLMETEQKVMELQRIAQNLSDEKQSVRSTLFQQLNILKKTALIESEISDEERKNGQKLLKKFNKVVYGQDTLDWDHLYKTMNNLQNGFYDEIREKYPEWSETEFRIFCLTYENEFNDTEIAIILNKTVPMIRKIRSKIRKEMGLPKYSHL